MTHDYGSYTPALPSAEALAIRDALADELTRAATEAERTRAESRLVSHLLTVGFPLEDFSTPSGRAFEVNVSVATPRPKRGREREARQWLASQSGSARTLAHKLVVRGGGLPVDLFEPLDPRVRVRLI